MSHLHPAQITDKSDIRNFILAGNATFTLLNTATGGRITFKVQAMKKDGNAKGFFVKALTGSDNTSDYQLFGFIWLDSKQFVHWRKSHLGRETKSVKGFEWFWKRILSGANLPEQLQVWHQAACGRCGRPLTVPSSISNGLGPKCLAKGSVINVAGFWN